MTVRIDGEWAGGNVGLQAHRQQAGQGEGCGACGGALYRNGIEYTAAIGCNRDVDA
ncbi:hypothetical protein [Burkholderia sp. BCC0322]|uniref:hypothetical protein n=1 Tax=unclassified Burkholderia TaxID=2613784 RepID=UPI001ABB4F94|nr:hypothetical protein [Burkholderia sp. BCC0322]